MSVTSDHQPVLHEVFQVRKSLPQVWSPQAVLVSQLCYVLVQKVDTIIKLQLLPSLWIQWKPWKSSELGNLTPHTK